MVPEAAEGGRTRAADIPAAHWLPHEAMNTHLSQSNGAGALAGQHGMSPAASAMADVGMSSCIAETESSGDVPAMAGRDNGANIRPAIIKIASNRRIAGRMVIWRFTARKSHRLARIERHPT
jgi:hypothetical protein